MPDVEEQIQHAIRAGKFADLPGKGKPLHLDNNPHIDPEWRLAYHLLQSSGYALPWIDQRNEIAKEYEIACRTLQRVWVWRSSSSAQRIPTQEIENEWHKAVDEFTARIERLNKRIRDYNLQAPHPNFQLPLLQLQSELERLTSAPLSDRL